MMNRNSSYHLVFELPIPRKNVCLAFGMVLPYVYKLIYTSMHSYFPLHPPARTNAVVSHDLQE